MLRASISWDRKRFLSRPGKRIKCSSTTTSGFEALRRMENSSRSKEPQVFSTEVGDNEIDYEQRCKYLEGQLEKFREQAAKVREVIGQKVCVFSSVVASLLKWLAAVNFAETYQCITVLFVSLVLFSLFCPRFLYDSSYLRRNLQPRQS